MITLGIDPGTAEMGWGIVEKLTANSKQQTAGGKSVSRKPLAVRYVSHGMIKTSSEEPLSKRLMIIKRGVEELVDAHHIDEIVIERVVFNVNVASAISVAQSYGVILLLAGERDLPVYEYNALEAKLIVAGHGRADKKLVQQAIKKLLRLKEHPTPVHAADALAIAICHLEKKGPVS
ncbi:crossover junction endodeoxyribonuclease RuvC [candidate division WWE3 bacterium RIFCSPLOWO2_01_FULL_53_14]|uniref:Crossover junction endodeoxyribonuclease RuvC n=1 Tax=candidate division WWE3 bacterium RIFCSPLOWO2_01_FULL_53_14 TaxID=1802628 RepID=A0A1F4VSZ0_UNCKA|nr:MAG: crossover junction endodeoxyribonuclease RuvC [candidate division WWE3 bacterium RIFCSPLOWO2_01_FULL_53_14]